MSKYLDFYRHLLSRGVSPVHAQGWVANIPRESSGNPAAIGDQGQSFGLNQWYSERGEALKRFAAARGKDWRDPYIQLDYGLTEADTKNYLAREFTSGADATKAFTRDWERPANPDEKAAISLRDWMDIFGGEAPVADGSLAQATAAADVGPLPEIYGGRDMTPLLGTDPEFMARLMANQERVDKDLMGLQELAADPLMGRHPMSAALEDVGGALMRLPTGYEIFGQRPGMSYGQALAASQAANRRDARGQFQDRLRATEARRGIVGDIGERQERQQALALQQGAMQQKAALAAQAAQQKAAQRERQAQMAEAQGRADVAKAIRIGVSGADKELLKDPAARTKAPKIVDLGDDQKGMWNADKTAVIPIPTEGMPEQVVEPALDPKERVQIAQQHRKEFDQVAAPSAGVLKEWDAVRSMKPEDMSAISDTELIKRFSKMVLPKEAVMSDDAAMINNAGRDYLTAMWKEHTAKGELSPEKRRDMIQRMEQLARSAAQEQGRLWQKYQYISEDIPGVGVEQIAGQAPAQFSARAKRPDPRDRWKAPPVGTDLGGGLFIVE